MGKMILRKMINSNRSAWYWGGIALFGISVLLVALYYQYARDEWPCVLCIHARIWVLGVTLIAAIGYFVRHIQPMNVLAQGLIVWMAAGLLERSLLLLGTERGTVFGACNMDSGLPAWFALDKWFPWVFEVQASCGYTPELWPGFTMAEALVGIAVVLMVLAGLQLLVFLLLGFRNR